mmetsp:Transcript_55532/g.153732  ORF Transcript_55532/g.153732 Transcript_55532/m.153732 type:complete len:309 (-) Transcript_55532:76-1002(-)
MAPAFMWALVVFHAAVAHTVHKGSDGSEDEVAFLQTRQASLKQASLKHAAGRMEGMAWVNHTMAQFERHWESGWFASFDSPDPQQPECGTSTFQELQMSIPLWRKQHPNVSDPFCHFKNHAMWFTNSYRASNYSAGRGTPSSLGEVDYLCDSKGRVDGPEVSLSYDAGIITWNHVRNCIDVIDDPYCFSLGWLKGQSLDGSLLTNASAWNELARQECAKIREEYAFNDEEVTVGRHVFTVPVYFRRTWNSLKGTGTPITKRLHKEHVYAKCLLGDGAPTEMSYCYFKGCVLPGNRIGHYSECNYDSLT